jgi:glycosyltransferase involved in cell wall biosynthesis
MLILLRVVSVVVPAHNEAAVIGRLLSGLLSEAVPGEFEVVVVANGCADDTASVASAFDGVRVVETADANKHRALRLGDTHAVSFPRLYVDADVELPTSGARALAGALAEPGVLAVGPDRVVPLDGCQLRVRWFYDVWGRLPAVAEGLFGRGVIGVSEPGYARLVALPELMGDDLAASLCFAPDERRVVAGARVVVHPPRRYRDLIRRRIRALTVTEQVARTTALPGSEARTSRADLRRILQESPWRMGPRVAWFAYVAVITRLRARATLRRADYTTWLRDESSRQTAGSAG